MDDPRNDIDDPWTCPHCGRRHTINQGHQYNKGYATQVFITLLVVIGVLVASIG